MAYMNQEKKKMLTPKIKAVLKKYGMKGSISVNHHSTLVVTIKEGKLDVVSNYIKVATPEHNTSGSHSVNTYWIEDHYDGEVKAFLSELKDAMNNCDEVQNFDKSDSQSDYFHVGWYIDISIGKWDKPYKLVDDFPKLKKTFTYKKSPSIKPNDLNL